MKATPTGPALTIRLLGDISVRYNDRAVEGITGDRVQSLLCYLLLHRGAPQSRQHIAFTLWPDSEEGQARGNLRNLLYHLRAALPAPDLFLDVTTQTLQWRPGAPAEVDVAAFEEALAAADAARQQGAQAEERKALERAIASYGGVLAPAIYDEWLILIRDRMARQFTGTLERIVVLLEGEGAYREAIPFASRLVELEPLDEDAYVLLMRLHALAGDRAGVRRTFQKVAANLKRELDLSPGPATEAAYQQWLSWTPAPPESTVAAPVAAPAPAMERLPARLPVPPTPFVGRVDDRADIGRLLADPSYRLVTLTGPGGIGKTRLAMQVASEQKEQFQAGVVWVALSPVSSADLMIPTIAAALGVTTQDGGELEDAVLHFLQGKELLLVLDNVEHLLEGVPFLARLLAEAPDIQILATSRVRLNLYEEWVWEVGGLSLPEDTSEASLASSSAAILFRLNAQKVDRHFSLDSEEERSAVASICRLVEGMPLGIELAASWLRLLSLDEIRREIRRNLDFLESSLWNLPPRHRSLRAVFNYSWERLEEEGQRALRQLALFQGPFTREAAAEVAGASLTRLAYLVDNSLLQRNGADRYSLHEMIRQFAAEQLRANPQEYDAAREGHARYFLEWLSRQEEALTGPSQDEILRSVTRNLEDIRVAWQWALEHRRWEWLGRATAPFSRYFHLTGRFPEGAACFEQAAVRVDQQKATANPPAIEHAAILARYGYFDFRQGNQSRGAETLRRSLAILEGEDETTMHAEVHMWLGFVLERLGEYPDADSHLNQALRLSRACDAPWLEAMSLSLLGVGHYSIDEYEAARDYLEDGLAIWRRLGDPDGTAYCLNMLGALKYEMGEHEHGTALLAESRRLSEAGGNRWSVAFSVSLAAWGASFSGRPEEAIRLYRDAIARFRELGDRWDTARSLCNLADVYYHEGEYHLAEEYFHEALRYAREANAPRLEVSALVGLARLAAERGNLRTAARWASFAATYTPARDFTRVDAQNLLAEIERDLDEEALAGARREAGKATLDGLVAEALALSHPTTGGAG